jgi:hypothetical protein
MRTRRSTHRRRLLALVPLLLVLGALPGEVLLRCQMDGLLRAACCCPTEDAAAPATQPTVAGRCCCEVEAPARERSSLASLWDAPAPPLLTALPTLLPGTPAADLRSLARRLRWSRPAREGPTILLAKQAFLI